MPMTNTMTKTIASTMTIPTVNSIQSVNNVNSTGGMDFGGRKSKRRGGRKRPTRGARRPMMSNGTATRSLPDVYAHHSVSPANHVQHEQNGNYQISTRPKLTKRSHSADYADEMDLVAQRNDDIKRKEAPVIMTMPPVGGAKSRKNVLF